jgi:hypothetical protein
MIKWITATATTQTTCICVTLQLKFFIYFLKSFIYILPTKTYRLNILSTKHDPEGSALTLYGVFLLFYRILKLDSVRTVIMDRLSI